MPDGPANDLLEELVHQFTDPFAFYRELIQNSIDSGSARIEVVLRFTPEKSKGLASATVSDWGEGMNRKVIEDYLLTKFRSSKEHDLTKIGKFGIGFVSLFACNPDAVVVDTGRDGESWRVLFKKDRSYELLKLEQPLEGTSVTLHKQMAAADYDGFVSKSLESVKRWCRHSESDIAFAAGKSDGSPPPAPAAVNEPFEIDAPFQVEHREEGTLIIAGVSRQLPAFSGLYNRGLTLLETTEELVPGVTLKVLSRWLEHTLTRDNVRRDDNFERAIALAQKLVKGPLHDRLSEELRKAAAAPDGAANWQVLYRYARAALLSNSKLWLRQPGGGAFPRAQLFAHQQKHHRVIVSADKTPLVTRMLAAGLPVVEGLASSPWVISIAGDVGGCTVEVADDRWVHAEPSPLVRSSAFCTALLAALTAAGARTRQVTVTRFHGSGADWPFALFEEVGRPEHVSQARRSPFDRFTPPTLAINLGHEELGKLEPLFERAPRLAALLMARKIAVVSGALSKGTDWALTRWALT